VTAILVAPQLTCGDSKVTFAGAQSDDHQYSFSPAVGTSTLEMSTVDGHVSGATRIACAEDGNDSAAAKRIASVTGRSVVLRGVVMVQA
jgi:hypothetical protein